MAGASLIHLATAEAPHAFSQADIRDCSLGIFQNADFDVHELAAVFTNAGVERRTLALPLDRYSRPMSPSERNRVFLDVAGRLLLGAAREALPESMRHKVTHVVTISSTGVATPSLECDVIDALGLPAGARRVPVFGLGCAGGVAGLAIARDLAESRPDALVLLLCVELTSLTFLRDDHSRRNFVAAALFGDGAAAALVGGSDFAPHGRVALGRGATRLFPETRDLMGWNVRDEGWEVVFSPRIPAVVRRHVEELVQLAHAGELPRHLILHPGGRKVLDAYREALDLAPERLEASASVLRRQGNMSSATVLFVLDDVLKDTRREPGPGLATAFGPGFSAEVMQLELLP